MGIYRTYFDKNNTIIRGTSVNTGRSPISELYFGNQVSRYLIYCSFNELLEKVRNKEIILDENVKHYLKMKNTSNFDVTQNLSPNNDLVFGDKYRSTSFDLELKVITEFWDEGTGFDFVNYPLVQGDASYQLGQSNWYSGTQTSEFATHGGTLDRDALATQHFDRGDEDLSMDITDYINGILKNNVYPENYNGFCLKYTDDLEARTFGDYRTCAVGFFTKYTGTFFEPYIETVYDDVIKDNRVDFYLNKTNRLYLYVNVDGQMTNLDILPSCSINGTEYDVKQQTTGVYYTEVSATSDKFDSYVTYYDEWDNLSIGGVRRPAARMKFVPKEDVDYYQIGATISEPVHYGISISGIKQGEKVTQGEKRRVFVHLRKPYTVEEQDVLTHVYYNLYIKQGPNQMMILDWQPVNKTYNSNSFTIDTTWMIPQVYYVDIKVVRNGEINLYTQELTFTIPSKMD